MALKPQDYEERLGNTTSTEDYYKLARDQEYSVLYDREVALENAKQNALKYTQNQINAQGFGGTGYGSTLQSGIYNQYVNKVGQAQSEYQANIKDLNQQEKQAYETEDAMRTGNITSMLQQATSVDQMNNLLKDYGLGYTDEATGQFVLNGEKPAYMTDDEWIQLKYFYNAQKDNLNNFRNLATNLNDLNNMTFEVNGGYNKDNHYDGTVSTIGEWFGEEAKTLIHKANNGSIETNAVIKVTNGRNDVIYLQWTGTGFAQVSASEYDNATVKHTLTHSDKQNSWN